MRRSLTIALAVVVTMLSGTVAAVAFGNFGDWGRLWRGGATDEEDPGRPVPRRRTTRRSTHDQA
jgi:hypothetical protein